MSIDASIRITAIVDQAVKALRQVSAEAEKVTAATRPSGTPAFSDVTQGAAAAVKNTKAVTEEARRLRKEQTAAATAAKAEAVEANQRAKAQKATSDEALKAQRAAANQARQLAPQLTDIVVGLITGQSPFTVLLQQGGQLKDVFGGVGNAFKAVASIFTVSRVVIGSVAAAFAEVAFAAYQGRQESDALNKTLALTGNIAGTSAGQLSQQAQQIAKTQNASISDVRATLTGLVATGEFTSTTLGSAGRAAVALSKLTGQTAAESIKQFEGLTTNVTAGATKLDRSYNFLTVEQYKYIQSLESQGRTQEATKFTLEALSSTLESRAAPAVGTLEKAWNGFKNVLSGVNDELKAIGRDTTPEDRLEKLLKLRDSVQKGNITGLSERRSPSSSRALQEVEVEIEAEQRLLNGQRLRASERAIDEKVAQEEKLKQSKGFQDAISAVTEAGAQKQLAERLAALDKQQAAIELTNAKGLNSAVAYNTALNAIEQKRLQAQADTIRQQIQIAGKRKTENPKDVLANEAQVKALEGQLAGVQGQIAAAASKGRAIVAADSLQNARDSASKWADIWQKAYEQVRTLAAQNGVTQAGLIADPIARATAEASLKTADLKRQIAELQRDLDLRLSLTIDPGQRAALQAQIADLATQSKTAIDERVRTETFASLQQQYSALAETIALKEAEIDAAVERGKLTTVDAERAKFAARAQSVPQLQLIIDKLAELGQSPAEKNAAEGARQGLEKLKDTTTEFEKTAKATAQSGLSQALTDIETGAKGGKAALLDMVSSFAKSMLKVLNDKLAEKLVSQFADAVGNNSSGFLGFLGALFGGSGGSAGTGLGTATGGGGLGYAHTGAVIGSSSTRGDAVHPSAFANAPRYHGGGIVGLKPRERAFIGLDGEEVLTEDNPRHVKNYRSSAGGVQITTNITAAQGNEGEQRNAADQLQQQVLAVVNTWAAEQSRQGGILAKR